MKKSEIVQNISNEEMSEFIKTNVNDTFYTFKDVRKHFRFKDTTKAAIDIFLEDKSNNKTFVMSVFFREDYRRGDPSGTKRPPRRFASHACRATRHGAACAHGHQGNRALRDAHPARTAIDRPRAVPLHHRRPWRHRLYEYVASHVFRDERRPNALRLHAQRVRARPHGSAA